METKLLEYELVDVEKLIPYVNNSRTHTEEQIQKVMASIKEFGFINPILITEDYVITAGHCRLIAAQRLAMKQVPCIKENYLTPAQRKAYVIADNRLALDAGWDEELLKIELSDLQAQAFDLSVTGFEEDEIADLFEVEDEAKDDEFNEDDVISENPYSKTGDIFLLGKHRLICGDSTDPEVIDKLVEKEAIDLVLTDPPYNCDYEGSDGQKIENDKMTDEDFREFLLKAYKNMYDHCKKGANAFVFHRDIEGENFQGGFKRAGFNLSQMWIWVKNAPTFGQGWAHYQHEPILVGWKEGAAHYVTGDRTLKTVLYYDKPKHNDLHPTMKPVELFSYLIKESTRRGNNILDSFGGSGTTLIAADQLDRKAFLCELMPKYVDVIVKRYLKYAQKYDDCYLIRDGEKTPLSEIEDYRVLEVRDEDLLG